MSTALLCCCSASAMGGVMMVDFELPEGIEAGTSMSGGVEGAPAAKSTSSTDGATGGESSGGSTGGSGGESAKGRPSSADASGGSGSSSGSGASGVPTKSSGAPANSGGSTPSAAGPGTGSGGIGPGNDIIVTDPVVLVSQPNGGGDHGPSVSNDPTFSTTSPLSVVANDGDWTPPTFAADLGDSSAAVDPGASAPEASAVIVWAVLGTAAAFGRKLRRRSAY